MCIAERTAYYERSELAQITAANLDPNSHPRNYFNTLDSLCFKEYAVCIVELETMQQHHTAREGILRRRCTRVRKIENTENQRWQRGIVVLLLNRARKTAQ